MPIVTNRTNCSHSRTKHTRRVPPFLSLPSRPHVYRVIKCRIHYMQFLRVYPDDRAWPRLATMVLLFWPCFYHRSGAIPVSSTNTVPCIQHHSRTRTRKSMPLIEGRGTEQLDCSVDGRWRRRLCKGRLRRMRDAENMYAEDGPWGREEHGKKQVGIDFHDKGEGIITTRRHV